MKPGFYQFRLKSDSAFSPYFSREWREVQVRETDGLWAIDERGLCIPIQHHDWRYIGPLKARNLAPRFGI